LPTKNGSLNALSIAWDSRSCSGGGPKVVPHIRRAGRCHRGKPTSLDGHLPQLEQSVRGVSQHECGERLRCDNTQLPNNVRPNRRRLRVLPWPGL
jgi:hypothetical protein